LRINRLIGLVAIGFPLAGCYTLQPAGGVAPKLGTNVAFDVNDVGRVALGGSMGPEIAQVEGRLLAKDENGSDYLVAVSAIRLLRGGQQVWSGEEVHIKSEYFSTVYLRRYSPARTIALSAAAIAAVAAVAGTSLFTGFADDPNKTDTTTGHTRRIPRPRSIPRHISHQPFPPLTTP
jgi:hypothetical protein